MHRHPHALKLGMHACAAAFPVITQCTGLARELLGGDEKSSSETPYQCLAGAAAAAGAPSRHLEGRGPSGQAAGANMHCAGGGGQVPGGRLRRVPAAAACGLRGSAGHPGRSVKKLWWLPAPADYKAGSRDHMTLITVMQSAGMN